MTITPEPSTPGAVGPRNVVECGLCGTRLRQNPDPHQLEIGADAFVSVARHRCVPRITNRRRVHA